MDTYEARALADLVRAALGYKVEMITMLPERNAHGTIEERYSVVARYMWPLPGNRSIVRALRSAEDWQHMQRECAAWSRIAALKGKPNG